MTVAMTASNDSKSSGKGVQEHRLTIFFLTRKDRMAPSENVHITRQDIYFCCKLFLILIVSIFIVTKLG